MAGTTRTIRAFVLHGRIGGKLLDYEAFFDWVGGLPSTQTRVELTNELVLAIEQATKVNQVWHFRFVSGNPSEVPLVYDERSGEAFEEDITTGRWRATPTRVAVMPNDRIITVEQRRAGVGAVNLERYFRTLARTGEYAGQLSLDMNPLPSPSFTEELDRFDRIREASIIVRRPNKDWDDADDVLSDLADESAAHRAAVTVNAGRGDSLARERGVVGLIRRHVRRPLTNVDDVRVKGTQAGSPKERTVSLDRHQLQTSVDVQFGTTLSEEDATIYEASDELLGDGAALAANLKDLSPSELE